MSEDWKIGDIAVCVELDHAPPRLELGRHYTVTDVFKDIGLAVAEADPGYHYLGFRQTKFRKLRPDEPIIHDVNDAGLEREPVDA